MRFKKPTLKCHTEVLSFIDRFINKLSQSKEETIKLFTQDMCYYFAVMLKARFVNKNPVIMYYAVGGHFAVKINNRIYDITGDITNKNLSFEVFEDNPEFFFSTKRGNEAFHRYIEK